MKLVLICLLGLLSAAAQVPENPLQAIRKPFDERVRAQVEGEIAQRSRDDSPGAAFEAPFKKAAAVAAAAVDAMRAQPPSDGRPVREPEPLGANANGGLAAGLGPSGADQPDLPAVPPAAELLEDADKVPPATMKLIPVDLDANEVNDDDPQSPATPPRIFLAHRTIVSEHIGKLSAATVGMAALGSLTYCCVCAGKRRRRRDSGNTPLPMTNPWPLQPGGGRRH